MENEIQKINPASPLAAAAELVKADGNMDVDKLAKLLEVQERWESNEARKAYVVAMANFKENPPEIIKDKTVSYKQTSYNHASLSNVTSCINKALSEHGLTASWVTDQTDKGVKVTCKITHVLGHSESTSLFSPPDTSGSKNPIQAIGSTVTYLQRYTLLALTGLATFEDDDGNGSGQPTAIVEPPTEGEQKVIDDICKLIVAPKGLCVDKKRVTAFLYAKERKYPPADLPKNKVTSVAQFITEQNRNDIFTTFEKAHDLPSDEQTFEDMPESGVVS